MACFDKALAPEWHRVAKCILYTGMKGKIYWVSNQNQLSLTLVVLNPDFSFFENAVDPHCFPL